MAQRADQETRKLIIELIEAHLTREEVRAAFCLGFFRKITLTSSLSLEIRGVECEAIEATLFESGQVPKQAYLIKISLGLLS